MVVEPARHSVSCRFYFSGEMPILSTMTRIDFHSNVTNKLSYVCRLVQKAYAAKNRVVITANEADLTALNRQLWTFSELAFLPHVSHDDPLAAQTPIILANSQATNLPHHDVLINLADTTPAEFASFERLIEIISTVDAEKAAGRVRYSFYKERGYPLNHFVRS
jgi:DNA polymerase-3 subunit chi